jgi:signal transduction histidine kinase/CheY-like chemotaxis protein/HPt (histidine-containing phosphotransfer) domain-containing protein/CHASE3 domain sensor protein
VKIFSVQVKIGFLMILAVVLLSATGYLSYRNLSSIVSSIQVDLRPDERLISIRDISMDLEKAQNSIRIYSSTHDTADLRPYIIITSGIADKIARLKVQCADDQVLKLQTDTISDLIQDNILTWNQMLSISKSYTVAQDLKHLSVRLDSTTTEDKKNESNILKKVFSKTTKNRLSEDEISNHIKEIEKTDSITKARLFQRESRLAVTSSEINEKFYDLITRIENEISALVKEKAIAADDLAGKTYKWIGMFSVCGTLLAILVMFIIVRYVRKTHSYQIALQHSKDEAEKLARTKELFMANMSHEIRTPVTAISGFTEQLLHESHDPATTRSLNIIKSSSDHLGNIINDILDFSKLQNDKLRLENVHFSLSRILSDVYLMFEKQAEQNNTQLSYSTSPDTPEVLMGDPYRLKQILINLVSNSVKFTKNGKVHYSVSSANHQSPQFDLSLEVTDNGIGIDESKISYIFEDFTQEEMSTTRKYGGTGLGLSIVKKLVELHKGTIECVSKKNHGTTITCRLPYQTGDEKKIRNEIESALEIPEEVRKLSCLIVDDEEYNRLLFKTILSRWNLRFREANNGMDALEILKSEHFDLLFMDARMPGIDGLKATRFIRTEMNISESEMPVICITAASLNDDWQKFRDAGMNAFMSKPFTEEMLLSTILSVRNQILPAPELPETNEDGPAMNEKINLKNLYHISGGDETFVKQMLISFIESTEKGLAEMQKAINTGDKPKASEIAHKLLPPCRHLGADKLYGFLKCIEEVLKNGDPADLVSLSDDSIREYSVVKSAIEDHIAKIA